MGFGAAFDFGNPAAIFREHAALSAFENTGERLFDLGALTDISDAEYDTFEPRHWPVTKKASGRLLGGGKFPTADGRARFIAVRQEGVALAVSAEYPLALNYRSAARSMAHHDKNRARAAPDGEYAGNRWSTSTRSTPPPTGLADGDLAQLSTRYGFARAKVRITEAQRPGQAFVPMHWSAHFAANAGAGALATPIADPQSGQPELKNVPLRISREEIAWVGILMTRRNLKPTGFVHWSRQAVAGGWVYELSGTETQDQGILLARGLLASVNPDHVVEYRGPQGPDLPGGGNG